MTTPRFVALGATLDMSIDPGEILYVAVNGAHSFIYCGGSMKQVFQFGDRLVIAPTDIADIRPGDIVVFHQVHGQQVSPGSIARVAHRVIAITPAGLITRGDNNQFPDGIVPAHKLIGRVTHVWRDGELHTVQSGRWGLVRGQSIHFGIMSVQRVRAGIWRVAAWLGHDFYRWLRRSGIVARFWHPRITKIRLITNKGSVVKYVCGNRTIACWYVEEDRFWCRKPYDLILYAHDVWHHSYANSQNHLRIF
jgi:signal peptidase I